MSTEYNCAHYDLVVHTMGYGMVLFLFACGCDLFVGGVVYFNFSHSLLVCVLDIKISAGWFCDP